MTQVEEWYTYGQITFRRRHLEFILANALSFRNGRWPKESRNSGYTDAPLSSRQIRAEGNFVRAAGIWAEVTARLDRCGSDGQLCLGYYLAEVKLDWLAQYAGCDEADLERRISRAIGYAASGPCRRWMPCPSDCKEILTCQHAGRLPVDYATWSAHRKKPRSYA